MELMTFPLFLKIVLNFIVCRKLLIEGCRKDSRLKRAVDIFVLTDLQNQHEFYIHLLQPKDVKF